MIQGYKDLEVYKRSYRAEGFGKKESVTEFKRFLMMAIGSCNEMQVLMDLALDLGFAEQVVHQKYHREYDEIVRMLTILRRNWK